MPKKDLTAIGEALDEISAGWLNDYHPLLAEALESAISKGATPTEIRRYVMGKTDRLELALRCEQAARFLERQEA